MSGAPPGFVAAAAGQEEEHSAALTSHLTSSAEWPTTCAAWFGARP
jgi:hypothetical protein